MGKDSKYNKQKDRNYRLKLEEIKQELPKYTYEFLDSKAQRNPNTAISYARDLNTFFEYLQEFCPPAKGIDVKDISIEIIESLSFQDINEFQKYLDAKNMSVIGTKDLQNHEHGIARRMCALRGFYKYMCQHEFIKKDPTAGATKQYIKKDDHVIIRMTASEVEDFLNTIKSSNVGSDHQRKLLQKTKLRDLAILTVMLRTGVRVSEVVGLDMSDLNFKENSMRVVRKGGKEHFLYFDTTTADALDEYITYERINYIDDEKEEALFLSTRKKRMAVRSIQEMVSKYAKVAVANKKISPHKMRSTYGTALYNKTGDIRLVADVLGHNDINTTAKHYAATEDEHRRQAAKINPYE